MLVDSVKFSTSNKTDLPFSKKKKEKKSLLLRSANFLREKLSTRRALREELDVDPGLVL
jgi:hypothetical protein